MDFKQIWEWVNANKKWVFFAAIGAYVAWNIFFPGASA